MSRLTPRNATMTGGGTVVRLSAVRRRFGYRDVLRGIDLEIQAGTCLALFGPNGAGKSTLLRIVATLLKPTNGRVEVFGQDAIRGELEIRRRLGVVFHQSFLRPELTLVENLRFYRQLYGLDEAPSQNELLERFGMSPYREQEVKTFSQGMLKRANLVRSLQHGPSLWLLDEPFSGLDPQGRELLESVILEFVAEGGTVVLVTHQTDIGRRLAHRSLMIDAGTAAPLDDSTAPSLSPGGAS